MRWGGDCGSAAAVREMPTAQRCFDSRFFILTALIQVAQAAADFAGHMFWRRGMFGSRRFAREVATFKRAIYRSPKHAFWITGNLQLTHRINGAMDETSRNDERAIERGRGRSHFGTEERQDAGGLAVYQAV